ncbi:MAG: hypothetical protein ACREUM_01540, partial [Nitrosospira sp.]
ADLLPDKMLKRAVFHAGSGIAQSMHKACLFMDVYDVIITVARAVGILLTEPDKRRVSSFSF